MMRSFKMKLYENLQEGIIGQDEYFMFKQNYSDRILDAEKAISNLEEDKRRAAENNREYLEWIDVFRQYRNINVVDRRAVVDLIDEIRVSEDKRIEVVFRHKDECDRTYRMIQMQMTGKGA